MSKNDSLEIEDIFVSQYELDEFPVPVQKSACGLASMAMVKNYFEGKLSLSDREEFLKDFINYGEYTVPTVIAEYQKDRGKFDVPVTLITDTDAAALAKAETITKYFDKDSPVPYTLKITKDIGKTYRPTFLLDRGTDVRGMSAYFRMKNYHTFTLELNPNPPSYWENTVHHRVVTEREEFLHFLRNLLTTKSVKTEYFELKNIDFTLIVSVYLYDFRLMLPKEENNPTSTATHLIAAFPCLQTESGNVTYADPYDREFTAGIYTRPINEFVDKVLPPNRQKAHFTIISKNMI